MGRQIADMMERLGRWPQLLTAGIGLGVTVVLALSTLLGGFWAKGIQGASVIVIVATAASLWRVLRKSKNETSASEHISLASFAGPAPKWMSEDNHHSLETLSRAALLLLAFDRGPSGCWGKSYLYRRFISQSGLPLAGGSLTGTPLALFALGSATQLPEKALHNWIFDSLNATLARILTANGQYRMRLRIGQTGHVEEFEPLRHAAGGLLTSLLSGCIGPRNIKTIEVLCKSALGPTSWDHAIVARALLQAARTSGIPRSIRRHAMTRYVEVLHELVDMAKRAHHSALAWVDPYDWGGSANTQWACVWALLPMTMDPVTPGALRSSVGHVIRALLLAQDASAPDGGRGLPSRVDISGAGTGLHVFATAISSVAWSNLAAHSEGGMHHIALNQSYAQKGICRLLSTAKQLLEQPSCFEKSDPLSLEGYFAWAGLLLAAASVGISISEGDTIRILKTAEDMERLSARYFDKDTLHTQFVDCCKQRGLFDSDTCEVVARSAARVATLYNQVRSADVENSVLDCQD